MIYYYDHHTTIHDKDDSDSGDYNKNKSCISKTPATNDAHIAW